MKGIGVALLMAPFLMGVLFIRAKIFGSSDKEALRNSVAGAIVSIVSFLINFILDEIGIEFNTSLLAIIICIIGFVFATLLQKHY